MLCVCSVVFDFSATLWTLAHQTSLSVEFSRQEYWSGFPFSFPGCSRRESVNSFLLYCLLIFVTERLRLVGGHLYKIKLYFCISELWMFRFLLCLIHTQIDRRIDE